MVKTDAINILDSQKQAEIAEVVEALCRFQPDKIVVEQVPEQGETVNHRYQAYCEETHSLATDEVEQVAFRVAAACNHAQLYCINYFNDFPFNDLMAYCQEKKPDFMCYLEQEMQRNTAEATRKQRELNVKAHL